MAYKAQNRNLPPVDTDVAVPAAIRAASLRADALHKQTYQTEEPPEGTGEPPEGQQAPEGQQPPTKQETPPEGRADDWEHKYKSLKPRFDKQDDTIVQLNGRISQLESMLARAERPPSQPRNPDLSFKPVDEDERDAYGEEFLDVTARAAREKLDPELKSMREEISQLKGQLGYVAEDTDRNRKAQLYQYLTDNLPSWREINRNPKFIAWCNLPDPFSNGIRMAMLSDAFAKSDAPRVLRFFNGFLTDEAATAPAGSRPELPNATNRGGNGKVPLENFAAPGRAKAPAGQVPPGEKETITSAQISDFYMKVQKGFYRGNEAEKERLERMIFAAQAEGRIV